MDTDTVPLLKALTEAGIASRRIVADAIKHGKVNINGQRVENFRHSVNIKTDRVSMFGRVVNLRPKRAVYLMINKPAGIISTTSDERGRRTVLDILPQKYRHLRLYPVGRLDKDSTGLLILTNDGELTYQLTHPKFKYEKEYLVCIDGRLKPDEKRKLQEGLELEDSVAYPASVREVSSQPPFCYSIIIHEGKKRQVRRMLESLGHHVLRLKRIRMASLTLGYLKEGAIRELTTAEVSSLRKSR